MARNEFVFVICYDITRPKIRRRVAALLEDHLCRVQMSVFEGRLRRKNAEQLFEQARGILLKGDSLRMYCLSATGMEHCRVSGGAPLPERQDFWLL